MAIKKICQLGLLSLSLLSTIGAYAQDNPFGQTFQINTRLNSFVGKPSWLIIVRDVNSGQVLPFLYNIDSTTNFWLGFTFAHAYQVITSELEFGPPNATIHNYCHLENGILDRESFTVTLTGDLTPNRGTSHCHVFKYKQFNFPIAQQQTSGSTEGSSTAPVAATVPTPNTAPTETPTNNDKGIGNTITKNLNTAVNSSVASGISNVVGNLLAGGGNK